MLLMANIVKAKYKNRHHFSKEALVALHTSQVVVQGSPLLVRMLPKIYQSISLYSCFILIDRSSFTQQHIGLRHLE